MFDTAVFAANNTFDPGAIGLYSIDIWGSADNFPTTDVLSFDAVITDSVYGRDDGDASRGWTIARSCGAHKIGNIFDVYVADELTSVSAHVNDISVAGANMFIEIYEVDTTGGNLNFIFLEVSNDYEIQTADIDNWVNINFDPPINMMQGQYLVVAGGYPSPVDTFGISTSGDAQTSMSRIQDNCGAKDSFSAQ